MRKSISKIKLALLLTIFLIMQASVVGLTTVLPQGKLAQADVIEGISAEKHYASPQNRSSRISSQENIEYSSYSVIIDSEIITPSYYNTNASLLNVCGAVAGANLIGYYDCEFKNLISDYESALIRGDKKIFKAVSSVTQNVINDLYNRMYTNTTGAGVTKTQFEGGLKNYINSAGYDSTINDIALDGQVDINAIKTKIENGIPMICFCTMAYYITNISIGSEKTTLSKIEYQTNHIMLVNGIKQIAFYQNGMNFRTDTYLKVAMGLRENSSAYILLSSVELDSMDALAIK